MEIAIIAHDMKKELMAQFCIAYCGILSKHDLCATAITAKYISEATGLKIDRLMSGEQGGEQQIASRIAYNEIDILLYFRDTRANAKNNPAEHELLRMCDLYNIPVATNIATAEVIITALERGDLDWREIVNPIPPTTNPKSTEITQTDSTQKNTPEGNGAPERKYGISPWLKYFRTMPLPVPLSVPFETEYSK